MEEFITLDELINRNSKDIEENNTKMQSNLNDIVIEHNINGNKNNVNNENENKDFKEENFIYQPQFLPDKKTCNLVKVGYSEQKTSVIKITELKFSNDPCIIVGHLYNLNDFEKIKNNKYMDLISLVINKTNLDIKLVYRYNILNSISITNFTGNFSIIFYYKKDNKEEQIKLKDIQKYSDPGKIMELLIKELSNPTVLNIYS